MSDYLRVTVASGKYTIIQKEGGGLEFLRYGQEWPAADESWEHCGLILALAQEVEQLRDDLAKSNKAPQPQIDLAQFVKLYKQAKVSALI